MSISAPLSFQRVGRESTPGSVDLERPVVRYNPTHDAMAFAVLLGSAAAFLAPGPRAWSPAFLSSGPGDQLLGVQRQGPPCQALVQWQGLCQAPLGRRPRDVKRHAVVLACDRKVEEEETSLEVVQSALRAVVSVIFVLSCADTCIPGPPYCTYGLRQPPAHRTYRRRKAARAKEARRKAGLRTVRAHYACQPRACRAYPRCFSTVS